MQRQLLIDGIMSMTCPTIRAALKARNLKVSGVKAVIQKRLLDSLPAEKEEDDSVCPICQEDLANVEAKMTTPCGHTFCTGCLLKWGAAGKDSCPCCRAVIPDFGREDRESLQDAFRMGEEEGQTRGFQAGAAWQLNESNERISQLKRRHKSEIDKLKSQHHNALKKIISNCKELLVPKEELDLARTERECAVTVLHKQLLEEKSRREQIELELRVANNRISQFEELASQITSSVSSHNLSEFNPMRSRITYIR